MVMISFFGTIESSYAQNPSTNSSGYQAVTSVSGDEVCGSSASTKCGISDLKKITNKLIGVIVSLGLPLLVVFIVYRIVMAYFAVRAGNAGAYKEALQAAGNAILGFLIIVLVAGGLLLTVLKFFGVKDFLGGPLKAIIGMLIPHAYAADGQYLPNPTGITSLYDFILTVVRFAMRFFVYPMLIVMWVWSGFSFVAAQGNPEGLKNARKWLLYAVVSTIAIFMVQSFLLALQGSVKKILPSTTTQTSATTVNEQYKPKDGEVGASCEKDGSYGQIGVDGVCVVSSGGGRR